MILIFIVLKTKQNINVGNENVNNSIDDNDDDERNASMMLGMLTKYHGCYLRSVVTGYVLCWIILMKM